MNCAMRSLNPRKVALQTYPNGSKAELQHQVTTLLEWLKDMNCRGLRPSLSTSFLGDRCDASAFFSWLLLQAFYV